MNHLYGTPESHEILMFVCLQKKKPKNAMIPQKFNHTIILMVLVSRVYHSVGVRIDIKGVSSTCLVDFASGSTLVW